MFLTGCSEDPRKIRFEDDWQTIIKRCKEYEVDVFECIYNTNRLPADKVDQQYTDFFHGLKKYVPKYFENKLIDSHNHIFEVKLENLLNIWRP